MPTFFEEDTLIAMPVKSRGGNGNALLLVLVLVGAWVIWSVYKKSSFYQGASMAGVWEGPMSYGPGHGAISGSGIGNGGDLMQLDRYLHGAPTPM